MAKRHDLVLEAIDSTVGNAKATKPYRMLEIGVYAGDNAVRMVKHAMNRGRPNVNYYGVDLFEDLTPTKSKEEMSKAKLPPSVKEVRDKIRKVTKGCWVEKGCSFEVIKANAITNIPQQDVIFIDGGHSLETIYQDWMAIQPLMHEKTVVVFDDYYHNRNDYGCSRLIDFLLTDPVFNVVINDHIDSYPNTKLDISCAMVTRVSNELALPVPNTVRGKPEWSDIKIEGTPKEIDGLLEKMFTEERVTDPKIIESMKGQDGPVTIREGEDNGKSETNDGHLSESGGAVPASGGSEGIDATEQHSSPSPVLRPERGAEDRTVGERGTGGPEAPASPAGSVAQPEGGIGTVDAGDTDKTDSVTKEGADGGVSSNTTAAGE